MPSSLPSLPALLPPRFSLQREGWEPAKQARRRLARTRLRRSDLMIGASGLTAAASALLISSVSPEAAGVLAVASMALLAGQRWAVGVVIVAELCLIAALLPLAVAAGPGMGFDVAVAWTGLFAVVPGLIAMRRGAAALALLTGMPRTRTICRWIHAMLLGLAMLSGCAPLL
jgi:hypothetical protein